MKLNIEDVTPAQVQLVKDLLIAALSKQRAEPGFMTRAQVRNAWWWMEQLGGPGERL